MNVTKSFKSKAPAPSGPLIASATYLPLRRWGLTFKFMKLSNAIEAQAKTSEGLVEYSLRANFLKARFWTATLWSSEEAMRAFVTSGPHREALSAFAGWAGEGAASTHWPTDATKVDWNVAMAKLAASAPVS